MTYVRTAAVEIYNATRAVGGDFLAAHLEECVEQIIADTKKACKEAVGNHMLASFDRERIFRAIDNCEVKP